MKEILSILLAVLLLTTLFAGCGNTPNTENTTEETTMAPARALQPTA